MSAVESTAHSAAAPAVEHPATTSTETSTAPAVESTTAPTTTEPEISKPVESTTATTDATTAPTSTEAASVPTAGVVPESGRDGELVKVEASPITSGNLGHKKAGLTSLFVKFKQFYFWLGDEAALDEATIAHFHKGDHEGKHHTAAHASQTGKGLLLYAKRAEDKTHPEGIFNLAEVSDVSKDGVLEFSFKVHEKKHSFQATKSAERDGWVVAVNNAVTEAKANKSTLRESDAYKASHKNYSGAGAAALTTAGTAGAATAAKDSKTEDAAVKNERRSTSRGLFGRGKSSDKPKQKETVKEKVEDKVAKAENVVAIKKEEHAEKKAEKEEVKEAKKTDDAAVVGAGATGATAAATTAAATEPTTSTPASNKRRSIFGNFGTKNKTAATTTEPVASTAPKVDAPVEAGEPLTESVPAATESTTPAATTGATATKKETSPSRKLFGLGGRSSSKTPKEATPDAALGHGPASTPFAASAVPEGAVKAEESTPVVEPASTAAATSTTEPAAAASATESDKLAPSANDTTGTTKSQERRRSSFAGLLGLGKNKDTTTTKTNGLDTTNDAPKENKLSNLFRSSSKAAPKEKTAPTTENAPPVPSKDTETVAPVAAKDVAAETPATTAGEVQHSAVTESTTADGEPATAVTQPHGTSSPAIGSAQAV